MQRALDMHPDTAASGIQVAERNGTLELLGAPQDAATRANASRVARSVPGVGPVRNRLGTLAEPATAATAGIRTPSDETLRSEVPRLMAALLVVIGRVVLVVEGPDGTGASARPSIAALGRVEAVLDLTL